MSQPIAIPLMPGFWLPRSYFNQVVIDVQDVGGVAFDGNSFLFIDVVGVHWSLNVRDEVNEWSSNAYTPDWLIDPALSSVTLGGGPVIDGYYIDARRDLNSDFWYIRIEPGGLPGNIHRFFLPPAPPGYWLPRH